MAQNIAIERVDHIGVRVRNLDRALGFYRVLGLLWCAAPRATMSRSFATSTEWNELDPENETGG
jgi:hypothetical protein